MGTIIPLRQKHLTTRHRTVLQPVVPRMVSSFSSWTTSRLFLTAPWKTCSLLCPSSLSLVLRASPACLAYLARSCVKIFQSTLGRSIYSPIRLLASMIVTAMLPLGGQGTLFARELVVVTWCFVSTIQRNCIFTYLRKHTNLHIALEMLWE